MKTLELFLFFGAIFLWSEVHAIDADAPSAESAVVETETSAAVDDGGATGAGGGGDPLATDFIDITRELQIASEGSWGPTQTRSPLSSASLGRLVKKLERSLEGLDPDLSFPSGKTVECFGVPKLGCVGADGKIRIARDGWLAASPEQQVELAAMELLRYDNHKDRYTIAPHLAALVIEKRKKSPNPQRYAFTAAQKLFGESLPAKADDFRNVSADGWDCELFDPTGVYSAGPRNWTADPDKKTKIIDAESKKKYSKVNDGLQSSDGELIRRTRNNTLIIRQRGFIKFEAPHCTSCYSAPQNMLNVIGNTMRFVAGDGFNAKKRETYLLCHPNEPAAANSASAR